MALYVSDNRFKELVNELGVTIHAAIIARFAEFGLSPLPGKELPDFSEALTAIAWQHFDLWSFPQINSQADVDAGAAAGEVESGTYIE